MIGLLTLRMAGAERVAFDLARNLGERWDLRIVALRDHHLLPPDLSLSSPPRGVSGLLFEKTDLLATHLFLPGFLARIRKIWDRNTLWVHAVHYHNYEAIRWGRVRKWLDHLWVFPAADALVAAGEAVAATLQGFSSVRTVLNAVDLGKEVPQPRQSLGPPVVGTVAMLRPEKGLEHLVDAASSLRRRLPRIQIRIAGEGPLRAGLERRIRDQELEETVELCGYVSNVLEFYQSLDVYVQPSRNEPFGIAALEAFRFGIPMVVTGGGFLPNLVGQGKWGIVVDHSEAAGERLADAIATAWAEREEWSARAREGLTHWRSALSVEGMVASYEALFEELLTKGSSR